MISPATSDLDSVLYALTMNQDGIAAATSRSGSRSTADLSPVHKGARILDVSVPGGLGAGVQPGADDVVGTGTRSPSRP